MPLPLARYHNGLTRIKFTRDDLSGNVTTQSFLLPVPSMSEFVRFTNFSDLVVADTTPPPSTVFTDSCSGFDSRHVKRPATEPVTTVDQEDPARSTVEDVSVPPAERVVVGIPNATEDTDSTEDEAQDRIHRQLEYRLDGVGEEEQQGCVHAAADTNTTDPTSNETTTTNSTELVDDDDRNSSVSSTTSSKRFVQTDIRDICAKSRDRKNRDPSLSENGCAPKRRRTSSVLTLEPIIIDDDEEENEREENVRDIDVRKRDAGLQSRVADDTASSFLCGGYVPSGVRSENESGELKSQSTDDRRYNTESRSSAEEGTDVLTGTVTLPLASGPGIVRNPSSTARTSTTPSVGDSTDGEERLRALHVSDDSIPPDARLPDLFFRSGRQDTTARSRTNHLRNIARAKEMFEQNMRLDLDSQDSHTHETDVQLIVSGFHKEMDFYASVLNESTPLGHAGDEYDGLRIRGGCSLHASREDCPNAIFPEHVPFVLSAEDFVTEAEWITVLVRYFDEYLNNAPFLHVMSHVLSRDKNVREKLNEESRLSIERSVADCLARFKMDMVRFQEKLERRTRTANKIFDLPKHPYEEKCTVVMGLVAICSAAYNIITPVFTDLAKICRLLLGNSQQTLELLNSSTMSTATTVDSDSNEYSPYGGPVEEDVDDSFDESVSRVGDRDADTPRDGNETRACRARNATDNVDPLDARRKRDVGSAHVGNDHSILASILRWNYPALADQTLWGLFFYYYHVHADGLTRIMDEVVHGGLMVTALLQAYFEDFANNAPVDVRTVCGQTYGIYERLKDEAGEKDRSLMPPPKSRGGAKRKQGNNAGGGPTSTQERDEKRRRFENTKKGRRRFQDSKEGPGQDTDGEDHDHHGSGKAGDDVRTEGYLTSFDEVLFMIVHRYLRPVSFDETTVVYTESGYEQSQNEIVSYFSSDKDRKRTVNDVFSRSTLKYSMPHGDLLMYNTDVMGTVHKRSSCTNNLVLNAFENMYGGCMSYLTRRFNNHLKIFNRFNGDAYRLVVECRHAMGELVRSVELSYLNLILRQPVVPPVLEADVCVRQMYMSKEEILKGAFVCLNAMDYVRSINMFTRHSKFSQENCRRTETFLDRLIVDKDVVFDGVDEEARTRFRSVYIFYQLFVFEVLYKIRHAYIRNGSYRVSVERLSWEIDVRLLLKLFFGAREFKTPRGLSPDALGQLDLPTDMYGERPDEVPTSCGAFNGDDDFNGSNSEGKSTGPRCVNTRPLVSAELPNKMDRMAELFGKKGIVVMKSYAPLVGNSDSTAEQQQQQQHRQQNGEDIGGRTRHSVAGSSVFEDRDESTCSGCSDTGDGGTYEDQDRAFLEMTQAQLEEALYSTEKWYDNCRIRVKAVRLESKKAMRSEKHLNEVDMCMDAASLDSFLLTQLRINIDNDRLGHVERCVRRRYDFAFCTHLPLRVKMMALVLATHAVKRMTTDVATDFVYKEYRLERLGVIRFNTRKNAADDTGSTAGKAGDGEEHRPDQEWERNWSRLLSNRRSLLTYCRSLADNHFPHSYFIGLHPDDAYHALYNYMSENKTKYVTLQKLRHQPWAKDVCAALNYLLVMNAYDPELVELCLRLFLGFEWPGQWAKRIFVWKSNSNAGKSYFFEHILRKAFDQSTCINDPKGGKDNAPEKSEYYKNFVLMINEFSSASAGELKKLCSTSSYKFRMNFGNQMIQAFMVGKMVFNCNTLPLTTDHATIQRVALVPLPFWFQKRQTVVDAMLNWTRGQSPPNDYERNFRRNVPQMLLANERQFFIENQNTRNEDDLFNRPNDVASQLSHEFSEQNAKASMFLVQNKTSQVYMLSGLPTGTIISGIVSITRYFCRFRFFNNIKEPVDYSVLPSACNNAAQEWQRVSQPYFEWKEKYRVHRDSNVRTKVSTVFASINHFAKNRAKNVSFFDLRQFFEWDFAEQKIPYYNAKEDEYYVKIDPIED